MLYNRNRSVRLQIYLYIYKKKGNVILKSELNYFLCQGFQVKLKLCNNGELKQNVFAIVLRVAVCPFPTFTAVTET